MAALYDGNGDRIFRLDYRKNSDYVSNKAGTAENVYYPTNTVKNTYDTEVILNEMLIPNGVTRNTAINYELTGYINDINSEYTQVLTEFGANGNTVNVYEYGAQRNSATINGTKGYYLYDGRGSVAALSGNSGGNMITYRYDAYGNTTKSNNTVNNPYQYNAEYTDSSTEQQYLRARYYDSSQGRFTTKDTVLGSIEKPITRNLYTYCGNNPLNYIDPSGHIKKPVVTPMDKLHLKNKIKQDASKNILSPIPPEKRIENIYGDYYYGPSYSRPTAPYRYDPVKNPFGEGKNSSQRSQAKTYINEILDNDKKVNASKRKGGQTALQKAIEKTKEENYKKYCENGADRAKDNGKKQNSKFTEYLAGLLTSLTANIADPTGILTSLIYDTLGVDISGNTYISDFESAYNAGKITGDVISTIYGMYELVNGILTVGGSIAFTTGGALATVTGVGAPAGVPVMVVSVEGVVVGVAEAGAGLTTMCSSLKNLYDDVQNYNSSRKTNPSKSESPIWKNLDNVKGSDRKTSGTGKNKRYYEWDNTHNDIEVYDKNGKHLGSMDPTTGEMYKPAVPGRTITIN